jgi:tRNA(Ile)-lysidine synthase
MLKPGERVLVAVSGGADSVALLICLQRTAARLEITVAAAHLNHRLRGEESDSDEDFVRRLCARCGIELIAESARVKEKAAASGQNLEEAAREARYEFLRRAARRVGAHRIAVGHTLNDQAETVLMRLFRGSGASGLSAVYPVVDGIIIRPLLETGRAEVLRYLKALRVRHREDSSNRDLELSRNRLRNKWIPLLSREFNPRLIEILAREADLARETSDFLERVSRAEYGRLRGTIRGGISLPAKEMSELHPLMQKLVCRQALQEVRGSLRGITSHHIEAVLRLCLTGQSGKATELPGGVTVVRRFKNVAVLRDRPQAGPGFEYRLRLPGRCSVPEAGVEFVASEDGENGDSHRCPPEKVNDPMEMRPVSSGGHRWLSTSYAWLDRDTLPKALVVRSRRPGDRYGGAGHRKVKKMLIDAQIDLHARARLPVVAAGDAVVWIPGFRPARQYAVRPDSAHRILLEARSLDREL